MAWTKTVETRLNGKTHKVLVYMDGTGGDVQLVSFVDGKPFYASIVFDNTNYASDYIADYTPAMAKKFLERQTRKDAATDE